MIAGRRWAAIIAGITVAGAAAGAAAALQTDTASAGSMPVVVIDAGHGGIDAGVYGVNTAVKESDINLDIAKKLRGRFVNAGFECVMTRTTNGGLYGNTSKGFKMRDMQQRRRSIGGAATSSMRRAARAHASWQTTFSTGSTRSTAATTPR